jgi:hypothetical protein
MAEELASPLLKRADTILRLLGYRVTNYGSLDRMDLRASVGRFMEDAWGGCAAEIFSRSYKPTWGFSVLTLYSIKRSPERLVMTHYRNGSYHPAQATIDADNIERLYEIAKEDAEWRG